MTAKSPGKRGVEVQGVRGSVSISGEGGQTVVIVASMLVLAESYQWLVEAMEGFRVVVLEMPGSGQGQKLKQAWSFERYARWLGAFLRQEHLEEATVIGHSNSAAAVILATARGDVHRAVLVDSVGAKKMNLLAVLFGRGIDAILEWRLTLWGFHHVLVNLFRHWRNFWNQVRLSGASDLRNAAGAIPAPTLVAWGGQDHTVGTLGQEMLAGVIPGARSYTCETGSHDWLLTRPTEFVQMLHKFVRGQSRNRLVNKPRMRENSPLKQG